MEEIKNLDVTEEETPTPSNPKLAYVKYGLDDVPSHLVLKDTAEFLHSMEYRSNSLKKARMLKDLSKENLKYLTNPDELKCSFCFSKISGVVYDRTKYGSIRCINCSRTLIESADELMEAFKDVKNMMESFLNVSFKVSIHVEMVNNLKASKKAVSSLVYPNGQLISYVEEKKEKYTIYVDSALPYLSVFTSISFGLATIWFDVNTEIKELKKNYDNKFIPMLKQGLGLWTAVQLLYLLGERKYAKRLEIQITNSDSEDSVSFVRYMLNYPLVREGIAMGKSPFKAKKNLPLDKEFSGKININKEELMKYYENI